MLDRTQELYTQTADNTKTYIIKTIDELNKEGVLSNRELYEILIGTGSIKSGLNFNMAPIMAWLKTNGNKDITSDLSSTMDPDAYRSLLQAGVYTTKLELETGSPTVDIQNKITLENLAGL